MILNRSAVAHGWAAVCMLASALALDGCAPAELPKGIVAGKVTFKGAPVTAGEVELYCQSVGVGATAQLNAMGNFVVTVPLTIGTYQVCVNPPLVLPDPNAPPAKTKTYPNIPEKARDLKTSGLIVSIKPGDNFFELELKE